MEHRIQLERGFALRIDRSVSGNGNGRRGGQRTIWSNAMAEATLVKPDIEASRALVDFLDANGFPLKAALWAYQADADRWRFIACPTEQRQDLSTFYRGIAKAINAAGSPLTWLGSHR